MTHYDYNHEDISLSEDNENLIVFNLRHGTVSRLNSVGTLIWTSIPNRSVEEIVDVIVNRYNAERAAVHNDVQGYIDKLLENKLIIKTQ